MLRSPDLVGFRRWLRQVALVPGEGGMVPPVLSEAQEGALMELGGFFRLDAGWYAAVKARQVGMTTLLLLWSLWMILNVPGFVIIWVSPHDKIAAEVLAKFRAIATGCGVKLARDNAEQSEVEGGGRIVWSSIGGSLATADVVGRAGTFHAAIMTEIAYPYEPELVQVAIDALEPALVRNHAPVFLDSTPNGKTGPGMPYFEMTKRIEAGEVKGAVWLCPWWLEPSYREDAPPGMVRTPEEERLSDRAGGLDDDQIQWRRSQTTTQAKRKKFAEKYPESLLDCFLDGDGASVLSGDLIEKMAAYRFPRPLLEPLGKLHAGDPAAQTSGKSWLRVYDAPIQGQRYYAGLDCASGRARDAQALCVLDWEGNVSAVGRFFLEGHRLASVVCRVCTYFGAWALIEAQWSAHVVPYLRGGVRLSLPGVPQTELDILAMVQRWRFDVEATSERSRTEIVGGAIELAEAMGVQDEALWGELRGLRRNEKGKIAAGPGSWDDLVSALGLAERLRLRNLARVVGAKRQPRAANNRERRGGVRREGRR